MSRKRKHPTALQKKLKRQQLQSLVDDVREHGECYCCHRKNSEDNKLEFHHVSPKTKIGRLSTIVKNRSQKQLIEEIKKCILLCHDCHDKIHWIVNKMGLEFTRHPRYDSKKE